MLSNGEVKSIVQNLEKKDLKPTSHLYKRFPEKTIGEASEVFSVEYTDEARKRPGLVLLSVVMAAHRNYTKQVEPQIDRIRNMSFYSFEHLKEKAKDFDTFSIFSGMRDLEKYSIVVELLNVIDKMKSHSGFNGDYEVMEKWALKANYLNIKEDIIGRIKGIGIATFQHLRMNYGANTVKPDQRVKEVLNREFKLYADSDMEYISIVEQIARIIGKSALYVDQVFVNYGSGYYINGHNIDYKKDKELMHNKHKDKPIIVGTKTQKGESSIEEMVGYIKDSVKDLDVFIEKRNDGGYIIVANELRHKKSGKNVGTYWVNGNSVAVIIMSDIPRTTFYRLTDMKDIGLAQKIRAKYSAMLSF